MRQKDPGVLHKQFSLPPSLVARTQHRRLSCDRALSCACWGEPPPASLRGWCSEVTLLGRRALCCVSVCVCGCLPALNGKKACTFFGTCAFYYYLFFLTLHPVQRTISDVCFGAGSVYFIISLYVCSAMYCALLPTPTSPSSPCAPPYLSPMEMRRGQGIWGEEHREAALHNLKGILMNQHSRTRYSHDNRPQTNSCIWSPLALWLWKCCVYVRERELVVVFVFGVQ